MLTIIHEHKDDLEQKRLIKEYADWIKPNKILDVGAGEGRMSKYFHSVYVGVDKRRQHINKATGHRIISRAKKLPFADKSFDFVFSCTAVMLNQDAKNIIREMARVSSRVVLFLEAKRRIGWAFRHDYEGIMKDCDFELFDFRTLRTSPKNKPLAVWMFRRKRSRLFN